MLFYTFILYSPGVYNIEYDHINNINNKLYIQCIEFRNNRDRLHSIRSSIKILIKDIKILVPLKKLRQYEIKIRKI